MTVTGLVPVAAELLTNPHRSLVIVLPQCQALISALGALEKIFFMLKSPVLSETPGDKRNLRLVAAVVLDLTVIPLIMIFRATLTLQPLFLGDPRR